MLTSKKKLLERCTELGISCSKSLAKEKLVELIQQKEKTSVISLPNIGNIKVNYIYHLADIHIRYIERHLEYREVFKELYYTIKNDPNVGSSVMVISGDLFHNRDRFVSETIVLFDEFVKKITELVELFVIVGNHDCFNHSDRLDSLSGISSIGNYSRFHLLKKSGIYNFSNISFGVSSLLDGMGVPLAVPEEGKSNVALYHGIVSGCVLDNGTSSSDGIPITTFNGYDMVLLGDVHRRQFLNAAKTIAYPGSLIQQNFKEELRHGFLKWNVSTKSSTFVELKNEYSFIDIPLNLDLSTVNFTKFSRIRLLINHTDLEQNINRVIDDCGKYTNVVSVKKMMKDPVIVGVNGDPMVVGGSVDAHELDIIKNMVHENKLKPVLKLHSELLEKVDYDEVFSKSLPWSIEKIEFRNIFSYGNDILNVINLKNGVTGILANNAAGKTNILNCLVYGLFGNTRAQNHLNKNIVSRFAKKEDLLVRLTVLMSDGERYFIERTAKTKTRSRIKSSEAGQLDVVETLKFYTDDKILNLSTKIETEKLLKDTLSIMSRDEFVLTNMMSNISYGSSMSIISMSGTQLDEVFNNIFNLNKYKSLHRDAKVLARDAADEIKTCLLKLEMITDNIKGYNEEGLSKQILYLNDQIITGQNSVMEMTSVISVIDEKLLKLKSVTVDIDEKSLKAKLAECEEILSEYVGNILTLVDKEVEIQQEYDMLKSTYIKADTLVPMSCETVHETIDELLTSIAFSEGQRKLVDFDADITNEYFRAKKYINSVSSDTTLDITEVTRVIGDLALDNTIGAYILPPTVREKLLKDLGKAYVDPGLLLKYRKVIEDKEGRDKIVSDNILVDQKISVLKKRLRARKIQDAHNTKAKLLELSDLLEYIDAYHEKNETEEDLRVLVDNKDVKDLLGKKFDATTGLEMLRALMRNNEIDLFSAKKDLTKCKQLIDQRNIIEPRLEMFQSKMEIYKIYIDVTHQKNLPKTLISNVIKNITGDANGLIYNTTGLLVEIQENEKWEIVVKKGDLILGPEHCSGYERFMLNSALKISFDKYKQLSSIGLFMIDETIDCVSESNLDQIDVLLECLQRHYGKVILISHNEDLKKKVNQRIEIGLDKKCSVVA